MTRCISALALGVATFTVTALATPARAQTIPPPPPPIPATATPSANPLATPSAPPSGSPLPLGSGVPSPAPSALPRIPIRVDRMRVGVVPGTTAVVNVSGGLGPIVATPSFSGADVSYDPLTRRLLITGRTNGRGTVTLSDPNGDSAVVNVLVAPPAGIVPTDVAIELAGNDSPQFVSARVQAAIAQQSQLQPGATLAMGALPTAALRPGDVLESRVNVTLRGNDTYVDQSGSTNVHLRVSALPQLDPIVLFYSDDPERLGPLDDGVLFRGTIDVTRPARAYVYHVSDAGTRRLYLALAPTTLSTSRVQVLGAAAGPSDAFPYVGHLSTVRYLVERPPQESFIATVGPAGPYLIPLGAGNILPGQLIAAIDDLRVLDGGPVNVMVVAASNGVDPATLLTQPEHPSDGHFRRGEFSLQNVPPLALSYAVGGPEPQPFAVGVRYYANGQPAFPNLRSDIVAQAGQRAPLAGDYGVLRNVSLQISNPTATPQNVYLYEQPGANGVTTTIWFTGDPAPTEVRCVSDPSQRYLVRGFGVAPGQTLTVTGSYMTDGTSFYPLFFGLTLTPPPIPPLDACGPKPGA